MAVLEIKDLHVQRDGKEILKGVNLKTGPGEVHAEGLDKAGTGRGTPQEAPGPDLRGGGSCVAPQPLDRRRR